MYGADERRMPRTCIVRAVGGCCGFGEESWRLLEAMRREDDLGRRQPWTRNARHGHCGGPTAAARGGWLAHASTGE